MKRTNLSKLVTHAAVATAMSFTLAQTVEAVPVTGVYIEDARCDVIPNQTLPDELGLVGFFPVNESINVVVQPATFTVCVPNDNIQNDWIVTIVNTSGIPWQDLFFVADLGMTIGNADGRLVDAVLAPNTPTDAMRIDGTVTLGINNNLLGESGVADEIFSPGEAWRFNVSNFAGPPATPPFPPIIQTPGVFAGSSPIVIPPTNTASILARPVPEPTFGVLGFIVGAMLLRRPRRA